MFLFVFCSTWKITGLMNRVNYFSVSKCIVRNSFTRVPFDTSASYYYAVARRNREFQWQNKSQVSNNNFTRSKFSFAFLKSRYSFVFILLILFVFSDAKLNPRPKNFNSCNNISIWQWNLNRVAAHNFEKVDPLEDYYRVDKVDAICLSELHLDSSLLSTC